MNPNKPYIYMEIEKEALNTFAFSKKEVHPDTKIRKRRSRNIGRAVKLGNLFKNKVRIFFIKRNSHKIIAALHCGRGYRKQFRRFEKTPKNNIWNNFGCLEIRICSHFSERVRIHWIFLLRVRLVQSS